METKVIHSKETAKETAKQLLKIGAVQLKTEPPFQWSSGMYSPIYCDNRLILSHVETRNYVKEVMTSAIRSSFPQANYIAGVATGGIAIGALIAQELDLPFIYIRSSAKKHGRGNQIEGHVSSGAHIVVIEDLISTGGSSLEAIDALKEKEYSIAGLLSIFTYQFDISEQRFAEAKIRKESISGYDILLEVASKEGYIKEHDLQTLQSWRKNPKSWSDRYTS